MSSFRRVVEIKTQEVKPEEVITRYGVFKRFGVYKCVEGSMPFVAVVDEPSIGSELLKCVDITNGTGCKRHPTHLDVCSYKGAANITKPISHGEKLYIVHSGGDAENIKELLLEEKKSWDLTAYHVGYTSGDYQGLTEQELVELYKNDDEQGIGE